MLLLRASALESPRLIEERGSYRGCRAWIDLEDDVEMDLEAATPVLDDATFVERSEPRSSDRRGETGRRRT